MSISKLITQTGITVYVTGNPPFQMARSHKLFDKLVQAVASKDEEEVLLVMQLADRTKNYLEDKVDIIDGEVFYNGEAVTGALVDRIIQSINEGHDADYLIKFLENLMQNPSKQSREELYLFLEACGDLPITEDGRFIAYKWVRANGYDVHSGTNLHAIGSVISMPRRDVNDDRRVTCSTGLHVCSSKYMKFGERLMLVAVNPKDVVSVPNDYDNGKMRVCEYEVMEEINPDYTSFESARYSRRAAY